MTTCESENATNLNIVVLIDVKKVILMTDFVLSYVQSNHLVQFFLDLNKGSISLYYQ